MLKGSVSLGSSMRKTSSKGFPRKVISFVGDMEKNIKEILDNLNCRCASKYSEFYEILTIFSEKIAKLRAERDYFKQKYSADVQQLRHQIDQLQDEIYKLQTQPELHQPPHIYITQSKNEHDSFNDLFKGQSPNESTEFQTNLLSEIKNEQKVNPNIENIISKYNITWNQLEHILSEYVEEQDSYFENEEEKKLFKLGKKLEKDLWMKKVKQDVQTLVNARTGTF